MTNKEIDAGKSTSPTSNPQEFAKQSKVDTQKAAKPVPAPIKPAPAQGISASDMARGLANTQKIVTPSTEQVSASDIARGTANAGKVMNAPTGGGADKDLTMSLFNQGIVPYTATGNAIQSDPNFKKATVDAGIQNLAGKPTETDLADKKAAVVAVKDKIDDGTASKDDKKDFMAMVGDLAKNWGVPILEILQAGAFGYTGNTAKKLYETRLDSVATKKEQDFMDKLNKDKLDYDTKTRSEDKAFESQQNKLQMDTQKQLQAQQLAAQERIAGLKNPAIAAPLTVGQYVGGQ